MSEIEKMYENAGIEKIAIIDNECPVACSAALDFKYPPFFTVEKQSELIKWLGKLDGKLEISCTYNKESFVFYCFLNRKTTNHTDCSFPYSILNDKDFGNLVAKQINDLWQDLTADEQKQIKEILK